MLRCASDAEREGFVRQGTPTLLDAIRLLEGVAHEIETSGYASELLVPPSVLLSAYPRGAAYTRHLDNYGDDAARELTVILYANPVWASDEGGALRLEPTPAGAPGGPADGPPNGGAASSPVEIEPLAGTMVIFRSRDAVSYTHLTLPTICSV